VPEYRDLRPLAQDLDGQGAEIRAARQGEGDVSGRLYRLSIFATSIQQIISSLFSAFGTAWSAPVTRTCVFSARNFPSLDGPGRVNPEVLRYLNRLSDLLFVLARDANDQGRGDVLWKPGGDRT
jgi:cob(I)alamin adenosyltransferase